MKKKLFFMMPMVIAIVPLFAQTETADTVKILLHEEIEQLKLRNESTDEIIVDMKSGLDLLRKIKLSGYMQSQFQAMDGAGISTFAGGNFPSNVASRFQVRRGRLKIAYENDLTFSQYALQFDVTQNGVGIKDAYALIKDPWYHSWNFVAGVFDRPFGFEVTYSSNMRETPERSRMSQTLFPGERELGAKIEFAPELGKWTWLNAKLGIFNGVLPNGNENDNRKDIIGRVGIILPFEEQSMALDGGASFYAGSVRSNSKFIYTPNSSLKDFAVDSTTTNNGLNYDRTYLGLDGQFIYDSPFLGGLSVRWEYNFGKQPGTSSSNIFYNPSVANTSLYQRNFYGYYVSLLQNIGNYHQFLIRYDVLDPNLDVKGSDIGVSGKSLTSGDIQYSTLGLGWIYHWDDNVKFTFYYEMVSNETVNSAATSASLIPFKSDVQDNVLTIRMQYRFPY